MTSELEHLLRKTQRHMLRSIFQAGRKRAAVSVTSSSHSDSQDGSVDGLEEADAEASELESWTDWIQRVTREVEDWNRKLEIEPWLELCRRRKHQWAGHIARRTDGRWSLRIMDWQPEVGWRHGGTGRGRRHARPKRRWQDEFQEHIQTLTGDAEVHWRFCTGDRSSWKDLEDDFAVGSWRDTVAGDEQRAHVAP